MPSAKISTWRSGLSSPVMMPIRPSTMVNSRKAMDSSPGGLSSIQHSVATQKMTNIWDM